MDEDRPYDLLKEMAANASWSRSTSPATTRSSTSKAPVTRSMYRKYGVPVALSTDDEGVSRIDLTHEYVRAEDTYHFTYPELKNMVRTGLEHSFLPGQSLMGVAEVRRQLHPTRSRLRWTTRQR